MEIRAANFSIATLAIRGAAACNGSEPAFRRRIIAENVERVLAEMEARIASLYGAVVRVSLPDFKLSAATFQVFFEALEAVYFGFRRVTFGGVFHVVVSGNLGVRIRQPRPARALDHSAVSGSGGNGAKAFLAKS